MVRSQHIAIRIRQRTWKVFDNLWRNSRMQSINDWEQVLVVWSTYRNGFLSKFLRGAVVSLEKSETTDVTPTLREKRIAL